MQKLQNIIVIIIVLAVIGWLKMPYEQKLSVELHSLKLVPPRLSLEDRSRLKQKAFVATYGSLRPTIAAFMSVRTTRYHSDQEWDKIEDSFNEIVLLDPYNYYYWDQASWHMASNAAADMRDNKNLTEVGRIKAFKKYIQKGKDIINKAIEVNPDDWKYLQLKAKLEGNRYRNPDYAAALATYREILKLKDLPPYPERRTKIEILFTMQNLPKLHQESYDYALELYHLADHYRTPVILNEIFIGQNHPLNTVKQPMTFKEIYGSDKIALQKLSTKWKTRNLGQKPYGVEEAVKELENRLNTPQNERIFPHKPLFMKE